jgi:hypothetical protein
MRKNKSINFVIDYAVYPFELMVSFGEDIEIFKKRLRAKLPEDIRHEIDSEFGVDLCSGRTVMFSGGMTAMWFREYPLKASQYALIAHEVFHAVDFLFQRINIKLSDDSNEAYAYLIQYITEQIYRKLWGKK